MRIIKYGRKILPLTLTRLNIFVPTTKLKYLQNVFRSGVSVRFGLQSKGIPANILWLWGETTSSVAAEKENLWILYGTDHQILGRFRKNELRKIDFWFWKFIFKIVITSFHRWRTCFSCYCSAIRFWLKWPQLRHGKRFTQLRTSQHWVVKKFVR